MSIEAVRTRTPLNTLGKVGKYVVLSIAVFLTLGPVVWTLFTALTPTDPITNTTQFGFSAFAEAFARIPLWLYTWNSALVTLVSLLKGIDVTFTAAKEPSPLPG